VHLIELALSVNQAQNRRVHRSAQIVDWRYERKLSDGLFGEVTEVQFLIGVGFVGSTAHWSSLTQEEKETIGPTEEDILIETEPGGLCFRSFTAGTGS